jgi:hypothetical protein
MSGCGDKEKQKEAYLETSNADIVSVIDVCVDTERTNGSHYYLSSCETVKRSAWQMDGKIGVAQILYNI